MTTNCTNNSCFTPTETKIHLKEGDGWPDAWHQFDDDSIWAIRAAMATGRPLLVRGEPGTGKSQLARAAAHVLERPLLWEVVNNRTEVTDLLYQFDAVARLAEAQIQGASKADADDVKKKLAPDKYVRPGRIWWAINWDDAKRQADRSGSASPSSPIDNWQNGCVLLVDEIDKADSELPNALLECFANQSFQVPHLSSPVKPHPEQPAPLVIVTTNEERELPGPFLRRCLVLKLALPRDAKRLKPFLVKRGEVHFDDKYGKVEGYADILSEAAELLITDRSSLGDGAIYRPGQAEYLDLCRAVFEIAEKPGCGSAEEIMKAVAGFTLQKNANR